MMRITEKTADRILSVLDASTGTSKYQKAVCTYAYELAEDLKTYVKDNVEVDVSSYGQLEKILLNGADNWHHYSFAGCALCYNGDLIERLLTRSQTLTRTGKPKQSITGEYLLGIQAGALRAAAIKVYGAAKDVCKLEEVA